MSELSGVRVFPVDDHFVVSQNEVWLPGSYDTEATARAAVGLDDAALWTLQQHINHVDGENRPITMADLHSPETGV